MRRIASEVGGPDGPIVAGLARATPHDIDRAAEAVAPASSGRIHTFLATSALHMEAKLRMTPAQVLEAVRDMVGHARSHTDDVEFSPEDATRSDPSFLAEVLAVAIEAGATTLNIPDTVGYGTPEEYAALIAGLIAETSGAERAVWSVHCHDDLGLATANTLAGLAAGARQAEVTINGIGERAGNASLEEVVMALATRLDSYSLTTGIDSRELTRTSRMVSRLTGVPVQPNKAIIGANAFSHEAGIHQDGILKDQRTYEIMRPETVGLTASRLVLGKHSGRHAFSSRLVELGVPLEAAELDRAFGRFKDLADRRKEVTDADLVALARDEATRGGELFELVDLVVTCGRPGLSTATARITGPDGETRAQSAIGDGPVEAAFRAIDTLVGSVSRLIEYGGRGVGEGLDALGGITVRIADEDDPDGPTWSGFGADTDIVVASARAYLAAVNARFCATRHAASAACESEEARTEAAP